MQRVLVGQLSQSHHPFATVCTDSVSLTPNAAVPLMLCTAVAEMQGQYSFQVPTSQLVVAFSQAELALNRAVKLSEQCRSLFETQPLLAGVAVVAAEAGSSGGSAGGQGPGWLSFTLIAVEQEVKVNILLSLAGLLAGSTSAGERMKGRQSGCISYIVNLACNEPVTVEGSTMQELPIMAKLPFCKSKT